MLLSLSIRDVVLIDKLELNFKQGLSVLTGETGAGKSILLDSLGLALGDRSEIGLIRPGAEQLSVTATFECPQSPECLNLLEDHGIDHSEILILKRIVTKDGRSRAFLNDQSVSVTLLKKISGELIEIHSQFGTSRLLESTHHRLLLDEYGGLSLADLKQTYRDWQTLRLDRLETEKKLTQDHHEELEIRYALEELEKFNPQFDEEEQLDQERSQLMHGEKVLEAINAAHLLLDKSDGVISQLRSAQRYLERVLESGIVSLKTIVETLERSTIEAEEATAQLNKIATTIDLNPETLESVEKRLFALRALARRYNVPANDLRQIMTDLQSRLSFFENGTEDLKKLQEKENLLREHYIKQALIIRHERQRIAQEFDRSVMSELPELCLDKAVFVTQITEKNEEDWSETGMDHIQFQISTNPGMPLGSLIKIASGGERSRLMLAMKVALARAGSLPTLIFDEVDSGISGAVAAAVGDRLSRLSEMIQILVVTHSPQVAARGECHWHVKKDIYPSDEQKTRTTVIALSADQRREEIARMLSGSQITDQARAAAESLLSKG